MTFDCTPATPAQPGDFPLWFKNAGQTGFSWWENLRKTETHVVIWAEAHDFAVVLAKRQTREGPRFYLLKTAYCLKSHRRATFARERDAFWAARND